MQGIKGGVNMIWFIELLALCAIFTLLILPGLKKDLLSQIARYCYCVRGGRVGFSDDKYHSDFQC